MRRTDTICDVPSLLAKRSRGLRKLAVCCGAIGAFWLVVLPWLAGRPRMQEHLEWLDERRIDPSAMYYTELEAMRPILDRINAKERGQ